MGDFPVIISLNDIPQTPRPGQDFWKGRDLLRILYMSGVLYEIIFLNRALERFLSGALILLQKGDQVCYILNVFRDVRVCSCFIYIVGRQKTMKTIS